MKFVIYDIFRFLSCLPCAFFESIMNRLPNDISGNRIRGWWYGRKIKSIGKNFQVAQNVVIEHPENLTIGDDVFIGTGSWISCIGEGVFIEREVMFGAGVKVVSNNHQMKNGSARFADGISQRIKIGAGSWIGANVVITAGSTIEAGVIVGASALVKGKLKSGGMYGGIPARLIRMVNEC
ncbi:acyltransferase [Marinobacter lipolyticus]|uniref:acyltransferase n=1 Tax=Marinobacter lipolyticus TaxID=209639 RepID=UPI001BCA6CC1|nr:acyltransferase [Marinobacter lipolyticus]MBS8240734.1 acyltransferase [Marinobacter lipolyticus]